MAAERSLGTIVGHSSGFFAQLDGIDWDGIERAALNTTHLGTAKNVVDGATKDAASMTFIPSDIFDEGSVRMSMFYNSSTRPPIDNVEETMTLTNAVQRGQTVGATLVVTAFMTSLSRSWKLGEKTMQNATLKLSGQVVYTPGS